MGEDGFVRLDNMMAEVDEKRVVLIPRMKMLLDFYLKIAKKEA